MRMWGKVNSYLLPVGMQMCFDIMEMRHNSPDVRMNSQRPWYHVQDLLRFKPDKNLVCRGRSENIF